MKITPISFSIQNKLTTIFLFFIIIIGIITLTVVDAVSRNTLEWQIENNLYLAAKSRAKHIESFLNENEEAIDLLASGISFREAFDEDKDYYDRINRLNIRLNSIMESKKFSKVAVMDKNGVVIASTEETDVGSDLSDFELFSKGKEGTHITDIYISDNRDYVQAIAAPIVNKGEFSGIVMVYLNTDELYEIVTDKTGLGETGKIYLVNKYDYLISPLRFEENAILKKKIDTENLRECAEDYELYGSDVSEADELEKVEGTDMMLFEDYFGVVVLGTDFHISEMRWCLLAEIDESEAFGPVSDMYNTIILFLILIVIFGIFSSVLVSKSITKPITKLRNVAKEIGKGNLDTKIKVKGGDEIGDLARTFNKMASDLKKYQKRLLESEKRRTEELEKEVKKKTKQLHKNLKEAEDAKRATINIMRDLNESYEKLKQVNKELKELDKTKTNFLNIVSHELKTPLTAVSAHLDVLDDFKSNLTKQELSSLEAVRRNSNQLKTLINNILEIARIEAKRFELNKRNMDLKLIVKDVVKDLRILSDRKGLKLITKIGKLPVIKADEMRLKEVLNNLIGNAIKFTKKGSVTIEAKKHGNFILVKIIDTGIGIPKDKMKKLFTKFYQVDSSLGRSYGGTGLGLSISKQLVEFQSGKIGVKSVQGKGSTFWFTLPIK